MSKLKKIYFDIRDDFKRFYRFKIWLYMILSKRGPGKTYSTLRYMIEESRMFVFIKRTIEDVKMLCASDGADLDFSPFKPLNRDLGWNIHPKMIQKGIAGFYDLSEEIPRLVGYCIAANLAQKIKGMDLSECDFMIFDEFIPRPWEKISRMEGDMVLDLYETISRDRVKRGRGELILILLANAVEVNNPISRTMELVDVLADMDVKEQEYYLDEDKGIVIHIINSEFDMDEETEKTGIQRAMDGTAWAASAYGAHFAYNDFTALGKQKLKGYRCIYKLQYKQKMYYVYKNGSMYFFSQIRGDTRKVYNLNRENQQKLYWEEEGYILRDAAINDECIFSDYTGYNLIINYRKEFTL